MEILNKIIDKELEHLKIKDFLISDNIEVFNSNKFTVKKKTNEIIFIYSQNYITGGYYTDDINVELLSEPCKAKFDFDMMENNFIKTIFVAKSNIDFAINCSVQVKSIIRYIKITPV